MAKTQTLTVDYAGGVCLREEPNTKAKVLRILPYGEKVKPDTKAEAPAGWVAVEGGGYTMREYLK